MEIQSNDFETMLEDSFFMINTDYIASDNNITDNNVQVNNTIRNNINNKYIYILLFLFLSTSVIIVYEHCNDIEQGFIKIGKLFN